MTEALHAVLSAVYLLGAHRIVAEVGPQNQACGYLLSALGFKIEGNSGKKILGR
jgi:RimJ/RimL family protein N-acetyltransferase